MKHAIKSVVSGLSILLANSSILYAQDFEVGLAAYEKNDYVAALREWRPLAEQGNADAQFVLALMYNEGDGVRQDRQESLRLLTLAAPAAIQAYSLPLGSGVARAGQPKHKVD